MLTEKCMQGEMADVARKTSSNPAFAAALAATVIFTGHIEQTGVKSGGQQGDSSQKTTNSQKSLCLISLMRHHISLLLSTSDQGEQHTLKVLW